MLRSMAGPIIAGIDEAGRGALAGPVVAAACVFSSKKREVPRIDDSKRLTPEEREEAFAYLTTRCPYGVGVVGADIVDREGILGATERAMHGALAALSEITEPTYLLIDGQDHFWFDIPHSSIIRGDQSEVCIAAASVIAKVTRDRWMVAAAAKYPLYGFAEHKGYGTEEHFLRLRKFGPCPLHRRTFLRNLSSIGTPSGALSS